MTIRIKKNIMKMQKMIIKTKYDEFMDVVNTHLSTGWNVMHGTFQICGVGENDDYEFRYGVVLEKIES
jgi:hypothetical protein